MKTPSSHPFFIKELAIKACRRFFFEQDFHEVCIPILNQTVPLEPNLYPFITVGEYMGQQTQYYLPTSPEAELKKMLAQGLPKVFALAPSFRNQEPRDDEHSPEFLMLEWYRANADYQHIMQDVEQLVQTIYQEVRQCLADRGEAEESLVIEGEKIDLTSPWQQVSLEKLFEEATGVALAKCQSLSSLSKIASNFGYQTKHANWEQLFNQIVVDKIELRLGLQPVFVTDFPARISPLCKVNPAKPYLAERFEVYLGGVEIGNGNNEETDADLVRERFEQEQRQRQKQGLAVQPIDEEFLQALQGMRESGINYAGVGVGVERVVSLRK